MIRQESLVLAMVFGTAGLSAAHFEPIEWEEAPDYNYTLSIAPVMLAWSTVDITAEAKVLPFLGIAVHFARTDERWGVQGENLWDLGGQVKVYPRADRSFSGLNAGTSVSWWLDEIVTTHGMSGPGTEDDGWGGGEAWAVSPFVGYKFVHRTGFTAELQAGADILVWLDDPTPDDGDRFDPISPLLRFNLGWSF
jgi:hypothetical protein